MIVLSLSIEYGDWSEENISSLKEGLRKFGRAWGKVYREVGGSKTATQCKMFYDDYCSDQSLGLQEALLEHSKMKVSGCEPPVTERWCLSVGAGA